MCFAAGLLSRLSASRVSPLASRYFSFHKHIPLFSSFCGSHALHFVHPLFFLSKSALLRMKSTTAAVLVSCICGCMYVVVVVSKSISKRASTRALGLLDAPLPCMLLVSATGLSLVQRGSTSYQVPKTQRQCLEALLFFVFFIILL